MTDEDRIRRPLLLPEIGDYAVKIAARGETQLSSVVRLGEYLRDLIRKNDKARNFRIFSPDEEEERFQRLFPLDVPVIFNFHGYTAAVKQIGWERPGNHRFEVNGYREEAAIARHTVSLWEGSAAIDPGLPGPSGREHGG